ncbi:MAG TPA: PIG-L family deacetylase [Candidatus Angelobacter sp.]|nr:PIG-L family deacetylase [Candidatus Angelobacter sp.]
MNALGPLLGTTIVLAAHPDDEVVACGALMQRMQRAVVVFATDGAPRDRGFWAQYGSRKAYAELRRQEARQALATIGAWPVFLVDRVDGGIIDQELFKNLASAVLALEKVVDRLGPDCILCPAYEGGHPDHDAACFMAAMAGRHASIPVWESPMYHAKEDGSRAVQSFAQATGRELEHRVNDDALSKKLEMLRIYRSQGLALNDFRADLELFRPLVDYDFVRPPLPWKLNYEHWGWPVNGEQLASAFSTYLRQHTLLAKTG